MCEAVAVEPHLVRVRVRVRDRVRVGVRVRGVCCTFSIPCP